VQVKHSDPAVYAGIQHPAPPKPEQVQQNQTTKEIVQHHSNPTQDDQYDPDSASQTTSNFEPNASPFDAQSQNKAFQVAIGPIGPVGPILRDKPIHSIKPVGTGLEGKIPLDMKARIEFVLRDLPNHSSELADHLAPLLTPQNITMMAAVASAYGIAHAANPAPWVLDSMAAGLVAAGAIAIGVDAAQVASHLMDAYTLTFNAESEKDLKEASKHLAKAISITSIDAVLGFTTLKAGQLLKSSKDLFRPGYNFLKSGLSKTRELVAPLIPAQWSPAWITGNTSKSSAVLMAKEPGAVSSGANKPQRIFDANGQWIPMGFKDAKSFQKFTALFNDLPKGTAVFFDGSAVTGKSFKAGAPFDVGRVSDFDITLVNDKLFAKALALGRVHKFKLKTEPNRIGPLDSEQMKLLGLDKVHQKLEKEAGRDVAFMLYESATDAFKKQHYWVK